MKEGNKVLILCNTNVFPAKLFEQRNVDFYKFYTDDISITQKILRRLTLTIGVLRKRFWYGSWFSNIEKYDKVFIFAINGIGPVINDIENRLRKGVTAVIFFWDPVFRVEECLKYRLPKWSFDLSDCRKYNLAYNSTFYFKNLYNLNTAFDRDPKYDIYFTGMTKGRKEVIGELESHFYNLGISTNFILVELNSQSWVSFEQNLENISNARSILDIVQEGQTGLTIRVMESIYWKKKLVTNNRNIVNEFFFNPKNIFVLGVNDLSELCSFLNEDNDFRDYDTLQEFYDFNNWLIRFNN
jgi:hypothetical protein